jgi:hypothetical protein
MFMTQTYPACPYCGCTECTPDIGDYFCTRCGANFDMSTACRMSSLQPYHRAYRIGDHHARENWDYLWCAPEFTREELRGYASGFLSAAYSCNRDALWLHGEQAKRDASWRD